MKKQAGEKVSNIRLKALDGTYFDLASLHGKPYLLAFFRFASCPFCNLRMHELVQRHAELGEHFRIVAIFDSTLHNLREHAERHHSPFPVLADEHRFYHALYGIEHSFSGMLKGMIFRMPTLLHALFAKGYLPLKIKGSMTAMPAEFLVDASGIIRLAYYGRDEGDHLPFEQIRQFALQQ